VNGDFNGLSDVFLRDRVTQRTLRLSAGVSGAEANAGSFLATISSDGRFVAFDSDASNLVAGDDNGRADVFLLDRASGTITCVSRARDGSTGNGMSWYAVISGNGRTIAFVSSADDLVAADYNEVQDVYVHDIASGETRLASVGLVSWGALHPSHSPAIDDSGTRVAFSSMARDLVPGDTNFQSDVFVRDLVTASTHRVSVGPLGVQVWGWSDAPAISGDGNVVAFEAVAQGLVDETLDLTTRHRARRPRRGPRCRTMAAISRSSPAGTRWLRRTRTMRPTCSCGTG
jgi:hypothetical protein